MENTQESKENRKTKKRGKQKKQGLEGQGYCDLKSLRLRFCNLGILDDLRVGFRCVGDCLPVENEGKGEGCGEGEGVGWGQAKEQASQCTPGTSERMPCTGKPVTECTL